MSSPDLLLVLGDQLERNSPLLASADPRHAIILMAEVHDESTHVPSHKARTALFVSAMRHCRDDFRAAGWTVDYRPLSSTPSTLAGELRQAIARHAPSHVRIVHPGDHRVLTALLQACPELEVLPDTHFLCSLDDFRRHASSRKQLRMEFFYREMRRRYDVLMDKGQPTGGAWNFDAANRQAFDARGPSVLPPPLAFSPDDVTTQVIGEVQRAFPANPGSLDHFDWPVTPAQAELALQDFLDHRLPQFGRYQDAMWTGQPWLYHSRLSAALNLKLLHPLRVIQQAEARYRRGHAPLAAELESPWAVADATQFDALDAALKSAGPLDAVVNCAGSILLKPAHLTTDREWSDTLHTNLTTAFHTVRSAARLLMSTGGSIVLCSTAAARTGLANHEAIAAAKAGVIGLTLSAAATYAPRNIRVNCVAPGLVDTPLAARITSNEMALKASLAMHPLGRIGRPEQVASAIAWLLHPENDWVTGQVLGVDGGLATLRSSAK